jgi:hypothetical protein
MALETVTRGAKQYYEQYFLQAQNSIAKLLFRNEDMDPSSDFLLDELTSNQAAVVYRDKDNQSHVMPFQNGSGQKIDIPRASEKTPITEELADQVIAGLEANSPHAAHAASLTEKIVKQHIQAHNMLKNKQALDVIFNGEFLAPGIDGEDLGLGIDYGRAASQEVTHDFTATDTILTAITEMVEQARATGTPMSDLVMFLGSDWITELNTDTTFLEYMQANANNPLLQSPRVAALLNGTEGAYAIANVRPLGAIAPVTLVAYAPGTQYLAYPGAAAADWITSTKAALVSLADQSWRVHRGMQVLQNNMPTRAVGEIVFDSYYSPDPVTDFLRSQSRHLFVMGDIDHTVVSTGTFA